MKDGLFLFILFYCREDMKKNKNCIVLRISMSLVFQWAKVIDAMKIDIRKRLQIPLHRAKHTL